jgi:two-component system KDP operon response regulator KdpE
MSGQEVTVLLVEDEPEIRRFLRTTLPAHGFRLYESVTGQEGLTEAKARNPDLILLDLGLPDLDGSEVIRQVREWTDTPIIVLSARDQEQAKVTALDLGADDYVTKPFNAGELLARLRVAQRHALPAPDVAVFRSGAVEVDLTARVVKVKGNEVKLTATEYALLRLLVRHAGKVLTHRQLLREVWGPNYVEQSHYLRVYIAHLREKLERHSAQPELIVTEPGVGYRLIEKE